MIKTESNKSYFYDGNLLLAEKVGSQITKIYINDGQGIIGMVRPIYDGSNNLTHFQRLYYLYDSLGSVSAITGEHGLPLQNYTYSPFGTCLNVTGDPINNLQFVGRYGGYLDNDTGLTYFWHRWYDSKDGRWISRDPIGVKGDINLYKYVGNQAMNQVDPTGLIWLPKGDGNSFYVPTWAFLVPPYGNYCGHSWSQGDWVSQPEENTFRKPPKDGFDACCQQHDECSYKVRTKKGKCGEDKQSDCDKKISDCFFDNWITNPGAGIFGGIGFGLAGAIGGACGN